MRFCQSFPTLLLGMLSGKTTLQRDPEVPSTEIDGDIVLMNSRTGNYYSLGGSAAAIWKTLENATNLDTVCVSLTSQYAVEEEVCRADVSEFVESLLSHRLVRTIEA